MEGLFCTARYVLEASVDLFLDCFWYYFAILKDLSLRVLILSYMKDWKKGMRLWRKRLESTWNSLEHLGYAHCAWRIGIWVQISMRPGMKNSSRPSPLCRTGKKIWMRYIMPLELIKYFYDLVKLLVGSLVISSLSNNLQYQILVAWNVLFSLFLDLMNCKLRSIECHF